MKTLMVCTFLTSACLLSCTAEGGKSGTRGDASVADSSAPDSAPAPDEGSAPDGKTAVDDTHTDTPVADAQLSDLTSPAIDASIEPDVAVPGPGSDADVTRGTDVGRSLPDGLTGVAPQGATTLPQFASVVDQNEKSVGPERFIGPWTVMWFYPVASTGG